MKKKTTRPASGKRPVPGINNVTKWDGGTPGRCKGWKSPSFCWQRISQYHPPETLGFITIFTFSASPTGLDSTQLKKNLCIHLPHGCK